MINIDATAMSNFMLHSEFNGYLLHRTLYRKICILLQILVPMLEASQKLLFVPIQVKKTGSISIPVTAMSVIGGDKATYKVSVGVSYP